MSIDLPLPGGLFSDDRPGEAVAETGDWRAVDDAAPDGPEAALAVRRGQYSLTPVIRTLYEHNQTCGGRPVASIPPAATAPFDEKSKDWPVCFDFYRCLTLPIMTFHDTSWTHRHSPLPPRT